MKIHRLLEKNFSFILLSALVLGVVFSAWGDSLEWSLRYIMMGIFFFVFMKVDLLDVFSHLKRPVLISYFLVMRLFLLPSVVYFACSWINADLALGLFLLAAAPPALASSVFVDLARGNTPFAIALLSASQIVAPFSISFLASALLGVNAQVDAFELLQSLLIIMLIPLGVSQILKQVVPHVIEKTKHYYSAANIVLIFVIIYVAAAVQKHEIMDVLADPIRFVWYVVALFALFGFLHSAGYLMGYFLPRDERIAFSVSSAYMNNSLAVIIALSFFSVPAAVVIGILSDLPWSTMMGPFLYIEKRLFKDS